ncbi:hypothetical protein KC887_03010 [Candidatus Kaiserbacteria bacterium]|nr:hypothetical protein [Candidatus Kaiserbacteria bacterium]
MKNKFAKPCNVCGKTVQPFFGYAAKINGIWKTCCKSVHCAKELGIKEELEKPEAKCIMLNEQTNQFEIEFTYSKEKVALVKGMPGARWNPSMSKWTVPNDPQHLERIAQVATEMGFELPSILVKAKEAPESVLSEDVQRLIETAKAKGAFDYQLEGVRYLSSHTKALMGDDMGLGKAQPLDAKVLTPTGFVHMGDLQVGDMVIGQNGQPTSIVGVFPQGEKEIFEVTFSDGSKTECCGEHLWNVQTATMKHRDNGFKTLALQEIMDNGLFDAAGNAKYFIPMVEPVQFAEADLPVDPYVLGILLGDGSIVRGAPTVTSKALEVMTEVAQRLPEGLSVNVLGSKERCESFSITSGNDSRPNTLTDSLRSLELWGCHSHEKFVPPSYLAGSVQQRRDLLAGLLDSDGSVYGKSTVEFSSTSYKMALGVVELVQSLGGTARLTQKVPTYTYKGVKKSGRTAFRVIITMPKGACPFLLERKVGILERAGKYNPTRAMVGIELIGVKPAQCIKVGAVDSLYVTDNYIVTHNTVQVLLSLPVDRGTLVVAPKAVLSNWRAECRRWRPDISPVIATGDELPVPGPRELVIVNYDNPKFRDFSGDINAFKGITLVADEAHLLKGSPYRETVDSKTGKIKKSGVLRVSAFMRFRDVAGQVWGLTGTPLANKPIDLWGVLSSLDMNKDVFGSWGGFTRCFNGYKGRFGWTFGGPTADVPERMRRVMIRRTKSEVLPELPGKVYTDLEVELSPELIADLDILSDEWGDYIAETQELPDFAEFSQVRAKLASDRIPAMLEQVELFEEQETPLVVFSAHRAPIDTLGKRKGWEVITGSTSTEERGRIVEAFQRGELKGVGLTIAAGGVGLTLTAASYMLFVDLAWRPSDNAQAEDRICRIGQKAKSCNIIRMVSTHPLDKHVHALLKYKQQLIFDSIENLVKVDDSDKESNEPLFVEESEEEWRQRFDSANDKVNSRDKSKHARLIDNILEGQRRRGKGPERDLTPELKETLLQAHQYMLSVCDGALEDDGMGFSKPDAGTARIISLNFNDERSMRALERLLSRYRRQLSGKFPTLFETIE